MFALGYWGGKGSGLRDIHLQQHAFGRRNCPANESTSNNANHYGRKQPFIETSYRRTLLTNLFFESYQRAFNIT